MLKNLNKNVSCSAWKRKRWDSGGGLNSLYLEKTGRSQYLLSSPNTWRKFLLKPRPKPFLSVPWRKAGPRTASDRDTHKLALSFAYFTIVLVAMAYWLGRRTWNGRVVWSHGWITLELKFTDGRDQCRDQIPCMCEHTWPKIQFTYSQWMFSSVIHAYVSPPE